MYSYDYSSPTRSEETSEVRSDDRGMNMSRPGIRPSSRVRGIKSLLILVAGQ